MDGISNMVTKSEWEKDKERINYFETDQSKRLTRLFWKSRNVEVQLKEMGFN